MFVPISLTPQVSTFVDFSSLLILLDSNMSAGTNGFAGDPTLYAPLEKLLHAVPRTVTTLEIWPPFPMTAAPQILPNFLARSNRALKVLDLSSSRFHDDDEEGAMSHEVGWRVMQGLKAEALLHGVEVKVGHPFDSEPTPPSDN